MVACLVLLFHSVFFGFYWFVVNIGLVDEGTVRVLSLEPFPWPFSIFWGAKLDFFSLFPVSPTLVRFLGGCLWGIGSGSGPSFMGGH